MKKSKMFGFMNFTSSAFIAGLMRLVFLVYILNAELISAEHGDVSSEYDFIVVGGGTAGCVVASRLSENTNYTVLLIENGGIPHPGLDVPALVPKYQTQAMKVYPSVPQHAAGLKDGGVINFQVGQVLGGGSSVNGMMFNRGSPHDYDNWAHVAGDLSWKYENLMPYFKKIEDYEGEFPSETQHGRGGPITVTQPKFAPGKDEWLQAGRLLGYPVADPNGPQIPSFNAGEFAKKFGRRVSSYKGYIESVHESRPHLKIIANSTVKRIVFVGNRAIGLVYETTLGGRNIQRPVKVRREIIVSAGVVGSAEVLLKSGIGPVDVLFSAGIPPVKYLPVGHNFQDHTIVPLYWLMNNRSEVFVPERDLNAQTWAYYNQFGDGPYSAYKNPLQAFLVSSVATSPPLAYPTATTEYGLAHNVWPDIHFLFCQTALTAEDVKPEEVGPLPSEHIVSSWVLLSRPKSSGRVTLNHNDPLNSDPLVDFNYYSSADDVETVLEGIYTTLKLFEQTSPYQAAGVRHPAVPIPECRGVLFRSQEYWRCYIKHRTTTGLHGVGTCRMGTGDHDPNAVVDSKLKVIGIENVRVADASIMPNVTNANTMAAVYVIAEKAADMILMDNRNHQITPALY